MVPAVAVLLALATFAAAELKTGEVCQPCRSSAACQPLSAPLTRQLQTQNLLSWETSIAQTLCQAGVCVPEAAEELDSFCDRLQGKVVAAAEQEGAAAGPVLRKGSAEAGDSANERRRALQQASEQGSAESSTQQVVRATAGSADANETHLPRSPVLAAAFSAVSAAGASSATAHVRPPVANINLAELARWAASKASPAAADDAAPATGAKPVARSLGELGFPFLDYGGGEGWQGQPGGLPGGQGQHPPGYVPPPPIVASPSPKPVVASPSPKVVETPGPPGGEYGSPVPGGGKKGASPSPKVVEVPGPPGGAFGSPGSGGNPGGSGSGASPSPKPHKKSPSPSPKPTKGHKSPSPSPKPGKKSPSPPPKGPPPPGPPGPPTGGFYDPRGGDPTVVFPVSPLSAPADWNYLRSIGANIVAAHSLLQVDDEPDSTGHFFQQVDETPKANVLAYGKGYVELMGTPLRVIPHVMNLEACARHCDADEQCTHWRRCAGGDCGAKLQECELMAAPAEDGAESDALPAANTVAPSVLELRAPSIRYIDPAQSNIIMESGTKSPSEFPPALYGCPYPAVPNGQLGQCIPPPQCNCAGGVCYGAC